MLETYKFTDYRVRLSLRGEEGKYVQDDEKWEKATAALSPRSMRTAWPTKRWKAEPRSMARRPTSIVNDALGREWQLCTIQVDFIQPARFGLEYVGEDGQPHTPVVLHRARDGHDGAFPRRVDRALRGRVPGVAQRQCRPWSSRSPIGITNTRKKCWQN